MEDSWEEMKLFDRNLRRREGSSQSPGATFDTLVNQVEYSVDGATPFIMITA